MAKLAFYTYGILEENSPSEKYGILKPRSWDIRIYRPLRRVC